jgi:hypothetical protein
MVQGTAVEESKSVTLKVPVWLYRALIMAMLAGTWGLIKYVWSDLQDSIDKKVERSEYREWRNSVDRQLENLWRRR